ncbi:piggyBac transposable element-derived protein 3-like, partial [Stegodyphus dumicola]|uniref:piggyBac transposable element-derived protein 3-like n=1 Tax=Stegodyphus dumicola TaxID=202533 RepID=UPI0015AA2200
MGYHSLPQGEMYWSLDKDISFLLYENPCHVCNWNMKQNLHLAANNQINNTDKLHKVRPYVNLLNKKFQQFGIFSHDLSIDEQMVPYRGKHSTKMFLKGKPIRFGYKAWTLASSDRYVFHFDIYAGKVTALKLKEYEEFGLGGSVDEYIIHASAVNPLTRWQATWHNSPWRWRVA